MSDDRQSSGRDDFKTGVRHDNLALRWESVTGEGRILAKGTEAVTLYQSDMAEGFRSLHGGFMALGRVQDDGSFRTMIRKAIPLQAMVTERIVVMDDLERIEDVALAGALQDDLLGPPIEAVEDAGLLRLVIDASVVEQAELGTELLA